ncbi:MAG: hypothetical protein KGL39_36070 [Patescibacteria group bacterium]|nr:hypothetical protein [Patescibacteria group bacterium]
MIESGKESDPDPIDQMDDDLAELIDVYSSVLDKWELVGVLELQLHVLKNRVMGYAQKKPYE